MRERRWGRIINISSQIALRGTDHGSDYAAAKAGMLGLTRSLALELGRWKITVNAIAPGTIDTDIIAHYAVEQREERAKTTPLGRLGFAEDVAGVVLSWPPAMKHMSQVRRYWSQAVAISARPLGRRA